MKIIIGSMNPAKIKAVQISFPMADVAGIEVGSRVSSQPFSDDETLEGAVNRARECAASTKGAIGIGLEGGVMQIDDKLYLCNWGALVDANHNIFTAGGARIPLPDSISIELNKGKELGDVMDEYAKKQGIRKKEGAIGVFTNNIIDRTTMFSHIVSLLKGQHEFANSLYQENT